MDIGTDWEAWSVWGETRQGESGPDSAWDHPLIEIRQEGEETSRTAHPNAAAADAAAGAKLLWRPMLWAREGATSRRFYNDVTRESVLEGSDNFLFMRIHSACEQIFEGLGLTDSGAARWVETLERRRAWCAERGAEYRLLVIPDSLTVYNDKLPGQPQPSTTRPILRILAAAQGGVQSPVVYPHALLAEGRQRSATFYPDDVHFTSYGAYLTYVALMRSLSVVPPDQIIPESALSSVERQFLGGYGRLMEREPHPGLHFHPPRVATTQLVKDPRMKPGKIDVVETEHTTKPSLVIFRTSNTTALYPFLNANFSRIVGVAGDLFLEDLIESERPDVVVTEIAERYVAQGAAKPTFDPNIGLRYYPTPSFEAYTTFPLPLPRSARGGESGPPGGPG